MKSKKILAFTVASFVALQSSCPVFAGANRSGILADYLATDSEKIDLSGLTNQQLNKIIDDVRVIYSNSNKTSGIVRDYKVSETQDAVKLAWLAAAQIAKNCGYPLAGSLVEASVNNYPFSTYNGYFGSLVMSSNAWRNYYNMLVENNLEQNDSSLIFERYDNADLFFGLKKVSVHSRKSNPYMSYSRDYEVNINDIFDFDLMDYDDLFVSLVNNWAWLCQQTHVLNPITVDINFFTSAYRN